MENEVLMKASLEVNDIQPDISKGNWFSYENRRSKIKLTVHFDFGTKSYGGENQFILQLFWLSLLK